MGVGELPRQARLAHARLAQQRHDLPSALARALQRAAEEVQLRVPTDEPGEPAGRRRVQAVAHGGRARELEDVDRPRQTLDGHEPARGHEHEPLGEGKRLRGQEDRPGLRHLLHARGQVRVWPRAE